MRRQDIAVGKTQTHGEDRARDARITLNDGELRAWRKDWRRGPPVDLSVVIHIIM
jgi:hypothetical protein